MWRTGRGYELPLQFNCFAIDYLNYANTKNVDSGYFIRDFLHANETGLDEKLRVVRENGNLKLVRKSGATDYQGDEPLLVMKWSLDRSPPDGWDAVRAAGDIVERFVKQESPHLITEDLVEAFGLANDYHHFRSALGILDEIKDLGDDPDPARKSQLELMLHKKRSMIKDQFLRDQVSK